MAFAPENYGAVVASLLQLAAPYPLVPRQTVEAARVTLAALDHAALFGERRVVDIEMADACLAGLWLWFDFLDESHTISQRIETSTGSFWHGILHRREPDWGNAKYWFARVRRHPVYEELTAGLSNLARANELLGGAWNAAKFVDLCERATRAGGELEIVCRQLQIAEWQSLFDHSYRAALGRQ